MKDIFNNEIDPEVDYARGKILRSSYEEKLKYAQSVKVIAERIATFGEDHLYIFTGNIRGNQLNPADLGILSEEWIGPSLFYEQLKEVAISHVSGNRETDDIAIFNRTSAANICTLLALGSGEKTVVSFAPARKHHPSVSRGAKLAQANLLSVSQVDELREIKSSSAGGICLITSVTSELLYLDEEELKGAISAAKAMGLDVVVDDAYGARIRPIVLNFTPSLKAGADVVITNNDKAGLNGPRAGIMVGRKDLVAKISAKANEIGCEARAPISLAVYRSLSKFTESDLLEEVEIGKDIFNELVKQVGSENVRSSLLGPEVTAETVLKLILEMSGTKAHENVLVPAEATAALGMELLKRHGIITTNACGMPGARISVRFKTNKQNLENIGSAKKVAEAFLDSVKAVGEYAKDLNTARQVILGV